MANVVEIIVTGKNLTKPEFDAAVRDARGMGARVGDQFTTGFGDQIKDKIAPKVEEPVKESGKKSGVAFAQTFASAFGGSPAIGRSGIIDRSLSAIGTEGGKSVGAKFSATFGAAVKDGLTASNVATILDPAKIVPDAEKKGASAGKAAGKGFAGALSPLIIGAFAAAATVGPAAVLGATALAVVGAGALITKGNQQLQESYAQLGTRAASAIQDAAAPLIPELYSSVQILEQGVAKVGPELKSVFAAVAPDVTAITGGLVSLVSNTLPGVASGLRAIAPFAQDLAVDFGKIGSGLGGFFAALGSGASGGMAGLNALVDVVQALLPDIGKIVASLSNGLGPALHDIADVAIPVANGLAAVVGAIPAPAIEAAAIAATALFAAFKLGAFSSVVAEGTTFLGFLGAAVKGEIALSGETGLAAKAMSGLGTAVDTVLGPLGVLVAVTGGLYYAISSTDKGTQDWTGSVVKAAEANKAQADAVAKATQYQQEQATAVAEANNSLATNQQLLAQSAGKAGDNAVAAMSFANAQTNVNAQLSTAIGDYQLAKGAASAYGLALQALAGSYGGMQAAEAQVDANLQSLLGNQKQLGNSFTVGKGAGDQNIQMMNSYTQSILSAAQAIAQQDADTGNAANTNQDLTRYINQQRDAFVQQESKILGSKNAAEQLFDKYIDIKNIGKLTTVITADTSGAYAQVRRLVYDINNTAAYVQVGVSSSGGVGGRQLLGNAHGGIVGAAATGGPRSNLTWVGEHGPELLNLAPGTRVHSNPDSMRMAASAGAPAWDGVVRLEISGADQEFITFLRKIVRARSGAASDSVQRVFG